MPIPAFSKLVLVPATPAALGEIGVDLAGHLMVHNGTSVDTYAQLASPPLTGVPTAPTAAAGTNTTQLATTAFAAAADAVKANLAGATFTGNVTAPTARVGASSFYTADPSNTADIFGIYHGNAAVPAAAVAAKGSMSTNAGFSSPVGFPNEESWYPYWSWKTPTLVETSPDGTTWTAQTAASYVSLFAYQPAGINFTTKYVRFTFAQPTFTYVGLVVARFATQSVEVSPITMQVEALASDGSVYVNHGTTNPTVVYDGAIMASKFSQYNSGTYGTRVTFASTAWVSGATFNLVSLMAYIAKPGAGRSFQDKFPITWGPTAAINTRSDLAVAGKLTANKLTLQQVTPAAVGEMAITPAGQVQVHNGTGVDVYGPATPAGAMVLFAGAAAPTGYLLCDGASYLRSAYPALLAVIGTTYGSVDGTHFTVPDMRSVAQPYQTVNYIIKY